MFKRLRDKIERALEAKERARPLSREDVDDLLVAMRREVIDLKARIPKLEKDVALLDERVKQQIARAEHAHEQARAAQSSGREDETRQAMEAVEQALRAAEDLKTQSAEAHADLAELQAEAAEKLLTLKDAQRNRSALVARSRRATTSERLGEALRGPESGLKRFERMEEDMAAAEDLAAAAQEVEDALGGRVSPDTEFEMRQIEAARDMDAVEQRLLQLKREIESDDR